MPKATATCNSIINLMYRATPWANGADGTYRPPRQAKGMGGKEIASSE